MNWAAIFSSRMLRRTPTALTVAPEDIAAFEEAFQRRIAYIHFRKTGEDPEGWFTSSSTESRTEQQHANGRPTKKSASNIDPNDELRPLPGDKARIIRPRDERIMGARR